MERIAVCEWIVSRYDDSRQFFFNEEAYSDEIRFPSSQSLEFTTHRIIEGQVTLIES